MICSTGIGGGLVTSGDSAPPTMRRFAGGLLATGVGAFPTPPDPPGAEDAGGGGSGPLGACAATGPAAASMTSSATDPAGARRTLGKNRRKFMIPAHSLRFTAIMHSHNRTCKALPGLHAPS